MTPEQEPAAEQEAPEPTPIEKLRAAKAEVAAACLAELHDLLARHGCDIEPRFYVDQAGRVCARIQVVVKA